MFAITINLIHNSARYKKVAKYTYFTKIASYILLFILLIVNFALLVGKTSIQKKVEELDRQYQTFLTANSKLTTSTAKVAYSYSKLQKIKEAVENSPQYFQQYEYLLSTVLADADVQIEDLSFDGKNGSTLRVSSTSLDELLATEDLTRPVLLEEIKIQKLLEKMVGEITVSPEELQAYWEKNQGLYPDQTMAELTNQLTNQIKQQKLRDAVQGLITQLQSQANVVTWL